MPGRNFTDLEEEEIARIYLSGKSAKYIMRTYGLKFHESIMGALRRQGITQRPVPERNRIHKLNPNIFDSLDNEESAYWHGFLYADGYVANSKTVRVRLSDRDRNHLEKFRNFTQSEAPISTLPNTGAVGRFVIQINITDRHLAQQLQEKGLLTKRPQPQLAFSSIPDNMFNHWLRGFFDGDGSARKSPSIVFCGGYEFLYILRGRISEHCEVNPLLSLTKHRTKNLHYLYYSGRLMALKVADYMYKDATVWMERKRAVIESWPLPQSRKKKG